MSTQTDNYGFVKPARTEKYMVAVFNANMETIDTILKQIADNSGGDVPDNVVTTDDVATITQAGIIKLYNSGGTNRSGLLVQADGALLVNTNPAYGTQRTGDGKLTTAGATEAEIDAGTNEYKPITPATIKYAVEKYASGGGITGPIGTDDIEDGAVTPEKATFTQYSETPVQIGTWIDGTPVWRLAFDADVAPGTPDTVRITFAADGDNVRVLNCKAWLTTDYNHIDATELQPYVEGSNYSTNAANGKLEIYKSSSGPQNHAYGYIEYVTPESNLPQA